MKRILLSLFALLFSAQALAATSGWQRTDFSGVRLIAASQAVGEATELALGLHFELAEGWKVYWRTAGDAGYPPSLEWDDSDNVEAVSFSWPAPERFEVLGLETLGYHDEVVLPLTLTLSRPGEAVVLKARVSYLACSELCIPVDTELSVSLPAGPASPSVYAHLIGRYQAKVPVPPAGAGLSVQAVEAVGDMLNVHIQATPPLQAPDLFVESASDRVFDAPTISRDGNVTTFTVASQGKDAVLGLPLTLTVVDGARAAEISATAVAATETTSPLLAMLALALLGGLILNLMPCVLPVLSMKLMGVIGHGGGDTRTVRLSFLASTAGIVAAFLVLAGALIALKGAGAAIGWGIQFQQPWFLGFMAVVVMVFAANLWGFFEVQLPEAVSDLGHVGHSSGLGGHFLTGVFATLLATPCSAPFLGTAVGFALARDAFDILAVFAALGVGLALPYLLVALIPSLATKLPKPGAWMIKLKIALGFALALTALWLLSVLAVQQSLIAAVLVGAVLLAITAVLAVHKRHARKYGRLDWAAVAVLGIVAMTGPGFIAADTPEPRKLDGLWQPFEQARIDTLVKEGHVVFVDVTAEWCITCQVNKTLVLGEESVHARLSGAEVTPMQADWTRPSDVIADYLAGFGRYGIPFNAVYGPGAPDGLALSEILSVEEVHHAIDRAQRNDTGN